MSCLKENDSEVQDSLLIRKALLGELVPNLDDKSTNTEYHLYGAQISHFLLQSKKKKSLAFAVS